MEEGHKLSIVNKCNSGTTASFSMVLKPNMYSIDTSVMKNDRKIFVYSDEMTYDATGIESVQTLELPHMQPVKAFATLKMVDGGYTFTYKVDGGMVDVKATLDKDGQLTSDYTIMGKEGKMSGVAKSGEVNLKGNLEDYSFSVDGTASRTPEKSMNLKVSLHVTNMLS